MKKAQSFLVGILAAGTLVATLTAATAAHAPPPCPTGSFCAWLDDNWGGTQWRWASGTDSADWASVRADDRTSSWANMTPLAVQIYARREFRDPLFCLPPGHSIPGDSRFDNKPSAHRFITACP